MSSPGFVTLGFLLAHTAVEETQPGCLQTAIGSNVYLFRRNPAYSVPNSLGLNTSWIDARTHKHRLKSTKIHIFSVCLSHYILHTHTHTLTKSHHCVRPQIISMHQRDYELIGI